MTQRITPAYAALYESGELGARAAAARARLSPCVQCPRECLVDRLGGETGVCRTGRTAVVASLGPHFGEERPLVGRGGSGTIFFAGCNLTCVYCQNHDISQPPGGHPAGREATAASLAAMMLELQALGCENVNLVSPSHVVAQILEALMIAVAEGLHLPLVFNTGGYDSVETLRLLDGVVDIYMPDMKYADGRVAARLSGVTDYVERNRAAVREMHRQVGDLVLDSEGVAGRGLLVRHLVLPGDLAGTFQVARFVAEELSRDTYLNLMDQYRPCHEAARYPEIARRPTFAEYRAARAAVESAGLDRLDR